MEKKLEKLIKISVFIEFYYENIYLIVTHLKDKSKYNIYLENLKELVTLEKKLLDSFTEEELSYLYNKIIFNYSSIETESTPLLTICAKIKEKYEYLNNDLDDDYDYIQENEIFHTINAIKDVYSKLIDFSNEYDILYDELLSSYYIMLITKMRTNNYIEKLLLKYDFNISNICLSKNEYDYSQDSYEKCIGLIYAHSEDNNIDNATNIIKRSFALSLFENYLSDLSPIDYDSLHEFLTNYINTNNNKILNLFLNKLDGYTR